MINKIIVVAAAPIYVPLVLIALHGADKPSKYQKGQAKRQKQIDKIQARRYNR